MADQVAEAERRDHREPDQAHRAEQARDLGRAIGLGGEQADQNDQAGDQHHRHGHVRAELRHTPQPLNGREHRDRRGDHGVAVEQRRAADPEEEYPRRPAPCRPLRQRHQRQDPALALVVRPHQHGDVFHRHHHDQRPQGQGHHADDRVRLHPGLGRLFQRVMEGIQRAGPDVAEHHADRAERQAEEPPPRGVGAVVVRAGRGRGGGGVVACHDGIGSSVGAATSVSAGASTPVPGVAQSRGRLERGRAGGTKPRPQPLVLWCSLIVGGGFEAAQSVLAPEWRASGSGPRRARGGRRVWPGLGLTGPQRRPRRQRHHGRRPQHALDRRPSQCRDHLGLEAAGAPVRGARRHLRDHQRRHSPLGRRLPAGRPETGAQSSGRPGRRGQLRHHSAGLQSPRGHRQQAAGADRRPQRLHPVVFGGVLGRLQRHAGRRGPDRGGLGTGRDAVGLERRQRRDQCGDPQFSRYPGLARGRRLRQRRLADQPPLWRPDRGKSDLPGLWHGLRARQLGGDRRLERHGWVGKHPGRFPRGLVGQDRRPAARRRHL